VRFGIFFEHQLPRPWAEGDDERLLKEALEQAELADQLGYDYVWEVEHHFLEEYSHCSNPEVLYGAIAARTERMRLGFGVRLMPKPYNHPVRTAESVAVLDLLSSGRVDFGTGRSATRIELEGFGLDPHQTRAMWKEAIGHVVGCWTHDEYEFEGEFWQMPKRRVLPKPRQDPHPPIYGATTSDEGHAEVGSLGLGLCSFAVGMPPSEVKRKIDIYRDAIAGCEAPLGAVVNDRAATFTMALCAPTEDEAHALARESFEWYPKKGARQIAEVAEWMAERNQELGNYGYAADMKAVSDDGSLDLLSLEYLVDVGACAVGTPDQCLDMCKAYEEAGVDLLLCLVNPYKIPHEKVMQSIELIGKHVIPELA